MSLEETYEWAKKQREEFEKFAQSQEGGGDLSKELAQGGDHPVHVISFQRAVGRDFLGEVASVDADLIFHFWPNGTESSDEAAFPEDFEDRLAEAFLSVFKFQERLFWDYVPELGSWTVRAAGWGENPSKAVLAERLFSALNG